MPEPEAGHDLVEDQQRLELVAQLSHFLVEVIGHRAGAALRADRFHDHGRRAPQQLVEDQPGPQRSQRIREELLGVGSCAEGDAFGFHAPRTGHVQAIHHRVAPAMVGAAHFDDLLFLRERAGTPDGRHDAFRARPEHPEHLDGWHQAIDQLCQFEFILVEETGHRPAGLQHFDDLVAHGRIIAAEHGRAAGLQEIDIAVPIGVPQVGAFGLFDGDREGIIEGQVVLHPAGDEFLGFQVERLRAGAFGLEIVQVFLHALRPDGMHRLADQRIQPAVDIFHIRIFGNGILLVFGHVVSFT